jgi:hypothetical protein
MRNFSIYAVSVINLIILLRYCILLYKKKTQPALAMWVFFSIAVVMSLITYLADGNYSIWDNILNATDVVLAVTVSIAILLFGEKNSRFTTFDNGCLIAVMAIIGFWVITRNHLATNLAIQSILVIAYFPVVRRLFESKSNSEPFSVWILMLIAPGIALTSSKGDMASVYSWRAIICVSTLLLLMLRIEMVAKKTKNAILINNSNEKEKTVND